MQAFTPYGEQGLLFVEEPKLGSAGPVVVAHGLSCSHSMWNLPEPGIKAVSPALAGGFLTAGPLGKSSVFNVNLSWSVTGDIASKKSVLSTFLNYALPSGRVRV